MKNIKIINFILSCIILAGFAAPLAHAQTIPEFLVSWGGRTYAPSWYQGSILPTKNSAVEVGFSLVDGNKIVNLANNEIRWYLENNLIKSGKGLQHIQFNTTKTTGNDQTLKIVVMNYKNDQLEKLITIPVVNSSVVINAPHFNNQVSSGENYLEALPYFFNVTGLEQLKFQWVLNNQKISDESASSNLLNLKVTNNQLSGSHLLLSVTTQNVLDQLNLVSKSIDLIVK